MGSIKASVNWYHRIDRFDFSREVFFSSVMMLLKLGLSDDLRLVFREDLRQIHF